MYLEHFGLSTRPFRITPNTEFFYPGCRRGEILDALLYAVTSGEGIVKVVGEVGSGKTMLCRVLMERLPPQAHTILLANPALSRDEMIYAIADELEINPQSERLSLVLLGLQERLIALYGDSQRVDSIHVLNPSLGRDEMLHTIAEELGIELPPDERAGNIIRLLRERLIAAYAGGRQVVLFIDEAQAVPLDTLEEVRLLSNLETDTHKLLQIVLLGQPELDQNLALPRTRQIRERITHSFNLPPMTRDVVREYVLFRMRTAGYRGPDPFSDEAIKMISTASRGVTRLINILADKALLAAFAADTHSVGKAHVGAAIRDSDPADVQAPTRGAWLRVAGAMTALIAAAAIGALMTHLMVQNGAPMPEVQAAAQAEPKPKPRPDPEPVALVAATEAEIRQDAAVDAAKPETAPGPVVAAQALVKIDAVPMKVTAGGYLERRLAATAQWLGDTSESHWTIQLGLAESADLAERFLVGAQGNLALERLYTYRVVAVSGERYAIAYGGFSDRESALAALAALPDRYRAWGAYPRTVRAIRSAVAEPVATR